MKKILLISFLMIAATVSAQVVNIPSPIFRFALLASDTTNTIALGAGSVPIKIDANNDNQIQVSEALAVHQLNLASMFLTNMTGLSAFTNLTVLDCSGNNITALDVSALTNLNRLTCSSNMITSLDVSMLTNLDFLFCDMNQLSNLNLGNIPELKYLSCENNDLANLTLSGLPQLLIAVCSYNQLTNLSLANLPALASLEVDHNQLSALDVSPVPGLTQLFCFYNQLTNLDISMLTNLTNLSCGENNFTTLNLNGLSNLSQLEFSYLPNNVIVNANGLTSLTNVMYTGQNSALTLNGFPAAISATINLSQPNITLNVSGFNSNANLYINGNSLTNLTVNGVGTTNAKSLYCSNGNLTSLTLNGLGALSELNCSGNALTQLSLSNLSGLTKLDFSRNRVTSINLSSVPNLKHLDVSNNRVSSLNLAAVPSLEYLDCSNEISVNILGNTITALDLAILPNLKYVDFSNHGFNGTLGAEGNLITSLNVNGLTHLEQLKCSKNNIPTLIVNGLTNLTHLDCSYNLLTSLDLIGLTNLTHLDYGNNQLSNLNMTGLVNITELDCSANAITTLNVVQMPALTKLNCSQNSITNLNLNGLNLITELYCNNNQIASLDVINMPNLVNLVCNSNVLTALDVTNLSNLNYLDCGGNQLTNLDVTTLTSLFTLKCTSNQLTNINVSLLTNLYEFSCGFNQLTSLDLSNNPLIRNLECSNNQLTTLELANLQDLLTLECQNNQLTNLNISASPNIQGLNCGQNQLTTLDVSTATILIDLACPNNLLTELFIKNGRVENTVNFSNNPTLTYICADEAQLESIQAQLNFQGMNATVSNSFCTFSPGGPHNTVIGTTIFDGNNNGCNLNDPLHPNIRVDFTDGTTTGSAFTNVDGICTFYSGAGNYTLFPNIENAGAFNISPASAPINFPDANYNISNQSFCLSANGVHPDVEIVISPISPARPGFDATYEIVYKNKGNQILSGDVTLGFDDSRLDLTAANPVADSQNTNTLQWSYSALLPFESRVIFLTFNVNSPTETPAVNNGDILGFTTSVTPVSGDETPLDNAFEFNQVVVNSFDPNDITCLEGSLVAPSEIGNYLHYIVNFENTGSASAVNIVVQMEIEENEFDIASLQVMNSSHSARTTITGNIVEFVFQDIQLAATAGDPPVGGHGNVLFKVKTNSGLSVGDMVSKRANIFFDYNFPIETTNAETTFEALSVPGMEMDNSVAIYPNPGTGIINIKSISVIETIELYDLQGRLLQTKFENASNSSLDISTRSTGVYFVKIKTDNGIKVEKLIKQ